MSVVNSLKSWKAFCFWHVLDSLFPPAVLSSVCRPVVNPSAHPLCGNPCWHHGFWVNIRYLQHPHNAFYLQPLLWDWRLAPIKQLVLHLDPSGNVLAAGFMVITTQELIPKSLKEFLQFKEHKQLKFQNKSQHVIVLHLSIQWTVFTCNPFPHQSLCCLYSLKALSKPERSSPLMGSAWLLFYIHLFVIMKWISWSKQIHYSIVGPEVCLDQVKSFHHSVGFLLSVQ